MVPKLEPVGLGISTLHPVNLRMMDPTVSTPTVHAMLRVDQLRSREEAAD